MFFSNDVILQVLYDTNGFLEKNRDPLPADLIHLLSSCNCQLLKLFSTKMRDKAQKPLMLSDSANQTVGTKFKVKRLENSAVLVSVAIFLNSIASLMFNSNRVNFSR